MSRTACTDLVLLAMPLALPWLWLCGQASGPTNDDWVYARDVQRWLERGELVWTSLGGQRQAAGATPLLLACGIGTFAGFSWALLHAVTLMQVWLGGAALYLVARSRGAGRAAAWLPAGAFIANPWMFCHGFTFMTDAPAAAWMAIAGVCWSHAARTHDRRAIWLGGLAAGLAYGCRQTALCMVALPLAAMWAEGPAGRRRWWPALALPALAVAAAESGWLGPNSVQRWAQSTHEPIALAWTWRGKALAAYGAAVVLGVGLLPALPTLWAVARPRRRAWRRGLALGALPLAAFLAGGGRATVGTATGQTVANAHFGPVLLSDHDVPGRWNDLGGVAWPPWLFGAATLAGLAAFALACAWAAAARRRRTVFACSLLVAGTTAVLTLGLGAQFDRYWLTPLAPLALAWALAARHTTSQAVRWGLATLAALYAVEVVWLHDLKAFHAARQAAVAGLLAEGFAPEHIDAGYEVNGWHRSAADPHTAHAAAPLSRWWTERAVRFVATGPRPGYRVVGEVPWRCWACPGTRAVRVLARDAAP